MTSFNNRSLAAQQQLAIAKGLGSLGAQQAMGSPHSMGLPDLGSYVSSPADYKSRRAIANACERLPFRVVLRLSSITFGPLGVIDPTFIVQYRGGKTLYFDNIDEFPSEADIAHICVNCPS